MITKETRKVRVRSERAPPSYDLTALYKSIVIIIIIIITIVLVAQ